MANFKWIKIVTDIFDDEKMLLIESLPSADSIIVIWFKLLCLAGKMNNSGVFILNDKIPYTDEMLATIFRRDINTVRLALKTFETYGMIEIINNVITIPNWSKHQNLDRIEERNNYMKNYMKKYREKQKQLTDCKVNSKVNSKSNVSRIEEEEEKNKNKTKNKTTTTSSSSGCNIFSYFQQRGFVSISSMMAEDINSLVEMYSLEEVKTAVDIADQNGKHTLSYVKGILQHRRAGVEKEKNNQKELENWVNNGLGSDPF